MKRDTLIKVAKEVKKKEIDVLPKAIKEHIEGFNKSQEERGQPFVASSDGHNIIHIRNKKYSNILKSYKAIRNIKANKKDPSQQVITFKKIAKGKVTDIPDAKNRIFEFVIQKHLADRSGRHFDWRFGDPESKIGHSFVTRKDPPKSGERVLAKQTKDHTIPWFDFQGRIDEGYGKGLVKRYIRDKARIISADKNKVTFSIGDKTRHSLIRMKDDNWLLVNHTPTQKMPEEKHNILNKL